MAKASRILVIDIKMKVKFELASKVRCKLNCIIQRKWINQIQEYIVELKPMVGVDFSFEM